MRRFLRGRNSLLDLPQEVLPQVALYLDSPFIPTADAKKLRKTTRGNRSSYHLGQRYSARFMIFFIFVRNLELSMTSMTSKPIVYVKGLESARTASFSYLVATGVFSPRACGGCCLLAGCPHSRLRYHGLNSGDLNSVQLVRPSKDIQGFQDMTGLDTNVDQESRCPSSQHRNSGLLSLEWVKREAET